ncbi:hypothetical protein [Mesorhizobium sp.]|uniref:hypothetical protein n=1 Tax=Mesorhizobium sp. TaxID=1871066 RepID=UPI000FEA3B55|nr:hypothetical protein [Mesorhizobium sp.]RWE81088.1 MAG: hypothetical protein EOS63_10440 [Mesorhizobium sp.]TJW59875.1 MAG: hypothetical protein E5V97_26160 [Mesorhizobium sp.]
MEFRQFKDKFNVGLGWQDTEKCDTFFLTIEGQALDPRPAAAKAGKIADESAGRIAFTTGR